MPRYSRCVRSSGVSSTSSTMPMTPFIGVRISWDMFARNSLFARLEASAASRARDCASSTCLRAVTSRATQNIVWCSSDHCAVQTIGTTDPCLCR